MAKFVTIFFGFINSIFIIRLIGAEGNGIYAKLMATSELFMLLTTLNSTLGVTYFSAKENANYSKIMMIAYRIILASLFITAVVLFILPHTNIYSALVPIENPIFYSIMVIAVILFLELRQTYSSILKGRKNFNDLFYANIFYSAIRFFLFGSLVLVQNYIGLTLEKVILLHVFTLLLHAGATYYFYNKEFQISYNQPLSFKEDYKPFLQYSGSSFVAILGTFLTNRANVWLIAFFLSTEELGYYALAAYFFSLITQLSSTLRNVLLPYLVSGNQSEKHEYLVLFSRINMTATLIIAIVITSFADWLIPLLYGANFLKATLTIKILLAAASIHNFRAMFAIYFYATNKVKYNVIANYLALATMLLAGILLIPEHGIVGAAISALMSYAVNMLLVVFIGIWFEKLPVANYLLLTFGDVKKIRSGLVKPK